MMVAGWVEESRRAAAVCVAGLASVALFVVLMLDGGVARGRLRGHRRRGHRRNPRRSIR